ncbi:BamA/TamA family outer membrane protein [Pedobacter sp. SYSU D00535]|uniref:translocation and assembly module lipoprotein TamL n=1 Tax=Pedobacter sp. SYSU D00535 TaxID=2810308 RepID=UPI001A96D590|nr:BamA/TamA family outer membrane protein [Pedobacter sp. SYSU D00535]
MNNTIRLSTFIIISIIISSCSATKNIPEGDYLFMGANVKLQENNIPPRESKALSGELAGLVRPRPNSRFLGIPFKLWIYNFWGNPNKEGGLGNKIRNKFGEPPVLFSSVKVDHNIDLIENRLENRGYFHAFVASDTSLRRKRARLTFLATPGPQYMISSVHFPADSSDLGKAINATSPTSFLKVGEAYDLDVIRSERDRIDARLKEQGFYYFSPEHLIVRVDSTNNQHKVDLYVDTKTDMPLQARNIYTIDDIYIHANYDISKDSVSTAYAKPHKDFLVIDTANIFKPRIFERAMFFNKGDAYNRTDHNLSLHRLVTLGTFKFVKNRFEESTESGDNQLDVYYYLSPFPKKSIRAELGARSTSANFNGTEVNLSWRNRNAFRGAELLTITAYAGTDIQVSGINKGNNLFRVGAEANLTFPRLISPFNFRSSSAFIPRTRVQLGYDLLNRAQSYILNSFRTSFGYIWKEDVKREHTFNLISVNYVQSNPTKRYQHIADSAFKAGNTAYQRAIEKQFIIGPNYNFLYTNTTETRKTNTFYENFNIDLSGNLLGLLTGANHEEGNRKKIFGAHFSQYVRLENDFRHYFNLGYGSQIASRLITGYGLAYGNSPNLPFIRQFFIGGTNSLRAFRARSLGPGTTTPGDTGGGMLGADKTGDVKLEINTEYRPKFNNILRGALFVDAGNIWLLNEDEAEGQSKFSKDFMKQLAVGAGIGLRFDLSFFVLRTDLATPLRKPWLPEGERWVLGEFNLRDKEWRRENLVFNLAIGYPF